jgi:hypothetical protein
MVEYVQEVDLIEPSRVFENAPRLQESILLDCAPLI